MKIAVFADLGLAALVPHNFMQCTTVAIWLKRMSHHPSRGRTVMQRSSSDKTSLTARIVWIDFDEHDEIFIITVDGIDCRINEPRKIPSTEWYSQKFNGPSVTYEIAIAIYENRIVWIRSPQRSGKGDLQNFRAPNGLKSKIPAEKKVIADRAYKDPTCTIRNPIDTPEVKKFKRRARACHESLNSRLKNFKVLAERFRHGHEKHEAVFEAVCIITQYELENGHPLFDV
jgi:DDE superfamily endonuclease